jgi:DNA-binding transcriptional ArsR family regulator
MRLDLFEHTLQGVLMQTLAPLHPTLWRTCRAIANRTRLRLFGLIVRQPDQTVCALACRAHLSEAVASQYLRAMEARGLLTVRRVSRWVKYRPCMACDSNAGSLVEAMTEIFRRDAEPVETIFRLATAFTHPRRIELFRLLNAQPDSAPHLRAASKMSYWALSRHLHKLENRGFIVRQGRAWAVTRHPLLLGQRLARLAVQ